MLNIEQSVQVSDTSKDDYSYAASKKNICVS